MTKFIKFAVLVLLLGGCATDNPYSREPTPEQKARTQEGIERASKLPYLFCAHRHTASFCGWED